MWCSENWKDYELLDTSDGERLERWGKYILVRPDPQIIWKGVGIIPRGSVQTAFTAAPPRAEAAGCITSCPHPGTSHTVICISFCAQWALSTRDYFPSRLPTGIGFRI